MNIILAFLKNKQEIIFFSLIFYGLSFFLIIKEYLIISDFSIFYNFPILELYRVLIILISIFCLFVRKGIFNKYIFFLIIINIFFLYSSFFGEKINFVIPAKIFYEFQSSFEIDSFFFEKNKIILINTFNIILPLIAVSFLDTSIEKLNKFKDVSLKICDILIVLLVLLLSYKYYFFVLINLNAIEGFLINLHSTMYFLNIYFLILADKIFKKKEINIFIILRILLIFYCFFIGDSILHPIICLLTFAIYSLLSEKNKYALILISLFFLIILTSNFFKLSFLDFFTMKQHLINFQSSGTVLNSLLLRLKHIEFFLFMSTNLNFLIGNNIFTDHAYTYPHNLLVDILVNSGIIGLLIFIFIIFNLIFKIKQNVDSSNLFIFILFFQSFFFSCFSGFFFTNIILNISCAACFCFLKPKHSIIP